MSESVESTAPEVQSHTVVVAAPEALPISEDIVVVAKTREEMETAQHDLISWVDPKIAALERDVVEAETNLGVAKKSKWATASFRKTLKIAKDRVSYYQRIRAALLAGYVIMPDLPGATVAVRTSQHKPRENVLKSSWNHRDLPQAVSDGSDIGTGRYVDPTLKYETWDETGKDTTGRETTTHLAVATGFDTEFSFPVKLVKPQVLDATSRAMVRKIFDEIGIIGAGSAKPGKKLRPTFAHGDPIVLGRVVRYEGAKRFSCAFLITWWVDTKTI